MTKHSALVAAASVLLLATTLSARSADDVTSTPGVSKVRIVRLSETKGQVQLDRNNGRGYEPGIANLPIVEKSMLKTAEGVAEIEFEDNSSLRVAPNSIVEFPRLERNAGGGTLSTVHLIQGMAYISLVKSNNNVFNLQFGDQDITLPAPSHIRLQLNGTEAKLAVLDGNLRVTEASGAVVDVNKKKTVTFDLLQHQQPQVAKDILPEPFDSWDHDAVGYHERAANFSGVNASPYSYGTNDLAYYGSFVNGCGGSMWRPYFASAAWDPFANGAWAYYQGAGYSWVSPYPWGWTPYHYGSWVNCQGMGWGWMPGGSWNGLNNIAGMPTNGVYGGGGAGPVRRLPVAPPHPPSGKEPTMLAVNARPLVKSELVSREQFQFRKDSAGLGIPRGGDFGKLNKVSEHVQQRGMVNQPVHFEAPQTAVNGMHPTSTAVMAGSIHRGSAPPPSAPMGGGANSGANPGNMGGYSGRAGGGPAPVSSGGGAPMHSSGPSPAPSGGPVSAGSPRSH